MAYRVKYKEELIENIKDCGQSIIDNAEKIVGDYKFDAGTYIELHVVDCDNAPYISVTKDFIPERFIEKEKGRSARGNLTNAEYAGGAAGSGPESQSQSYGL